MATESSPSHNKEYATMLEELRVLLPGVEVLFAFLLTVPFTERFSSMTGLQRGAYFLAFIAAAVASALFIAPGVHHRLRFREVAAEHALRVGNVLAISGTVSLALSISASVFVVTDMLFSHTIAATITAGIGGGIVLLWYAFPLRKQSEGEGSRDPADAHRSARSSPATTSPGAEAPRG